MYWSLPGILLTGYFLVSSLGKCMCLDRELILADVYYPLFPFYVH